MLFSNSTAVSGASNVLAWSAFNFGNVILFRKESISLTCLSLSVVYTLL